MMNRSLLLLVAVVGLGVIFQPHKAEAVAVGQSCGKPGTTGMSDDQRTGVMCLYDGSRSLVWKQITGAPQSVADSQGNPVAHFENGGVVWNAPSPKSESAAAAPATHALLASAPSPWQGWYVGVNAGYARTTNAQTDKDFFVNGGTENQINGGPTAGLVGGYNWVQNNVLFGFEADANYLRNGGTQEYCATCEAPGAEKSDWRGYTTARGRVGIISDPALIFLTAGLAAADIGDAFASQNNLGGNFTKNGISFGWTTGAGAEVAVTDTISLSFQYLYLQMLQRHSKLGSGGQTGSFLLDNSASILRTGVNWHFN